MARIPMTSGFVIIPEGFTLLVDIQRAVHESGETTVLIIAELVPERNDVPCQLLYKFFSLHAFVPLV